MEHRRRTWNREDMTARVSSWDTYMRGTFVLPPGHPPTPEESRVHQGMVHLDDLSLAEDLQSLGICTYVQ